MAQLFVLSGPEVGKTFTVQAGDAVGRTAETPITLKHASISRRHAHFECVGGRWSLVDDGSTNGLTFQKARVQRLELVDGCEFQMGELFLRFRAGEAESDTPRVASARTIAPSAAVAAAEDEIQLEGADEPAPPAPRPEFRPPPTPAHAEPEITLRRPAAPPAPAPVAPRAAPVDTGFGPAPAGAGATISRNKERSGERVLQYSKVENRGGLANADLSQIGGFTKLLIVVFALAFTSALAWFAFSGAAWFKERASGAASSAVESEPEDEPDNEPASER